MTNNTNKVWEIFCDEIRCRDPFGNTRTYDVKTDEDVKQALSVTLRAVVECVYPGYDGVFLAWKAEILKIADELEVL